MKNVQHLKRAVENAGGRLEEDEPANDCRIFQAVAPEGKIWKGSDTQCLVVWWAIGSSAQAAKFNEESLDDVLERMSHGLRDLNDEEEMIYATE